MRKVGEVGMTYTEFIVIVLMISLACVLAFTTLIICNGTQQALYDFKKEFRRFRDGEQYQCYVENPVVGIKLNADGSWSEVHANDK